MEWWQYILIGMASVAAGMLLGLLITSVGKRFFREGRAIPATEERLKFAISDLLEEIEYNLTVAKEKWTGKLRPFQTRVGSEHLDQVSKLPSSLRADLVQVYMYISLANVMIGVSAESNHESTADDEQYVRMYSRITESLDNIKPLLEELVR